MGEQRIQEVTMFALLFLLLGIVFLLAAVGRIWINPASLDSRVSDSAAANNPDESVRLNHIAEGKDSAA